MRRRSWPGKHIGDLRVRPFGAAFCVEHIRTLRSDLSTSAVACEDVGLAGMAREVLPVAMPAIGETPRAGKVLG